MMALIRPIQIGPIEYPTGVAISPNAYLIHHDPTLYPDPYALRPERFLDEPLGTYTWIPFGGGPRRCIGASFAQLEMKILLRAVLARFELRADTTGRPQLASRAFDHADPERWKPSGATGRCFGLGVTRRPRIEPPGQRV